MPVEIRSALAASIKTITRDWTEAKRHADRQQRVSARELERLRQITKPRVVSIKDAAYAVMETAYLKASSQGRLPANARQIMYAARPYILAHATKPWSKKTDQWVTQHIIPDFISEHPALTATWDVVFDDRGHFLEPHTATRIGLGTLAVRGYWRGWTNGQVNPQITTHDVMRTQARVGTSGPHSRYGAVLFVDKEGFDSLWEAVSLAERFDLAIMSTKGMSVTAARQLVEHISDAGVPIYVLHDFDKAGFSILHTLRTTTRRYQFQRAPQVHDLGLRLADVQAMQLDGEPVEYRSDTDPRINLRESGATDDECDFLVHGRDAQGIWHGERVELNAMDSEQLVTWLEDKLQVEGVCKVVPDTEVLANAYQRASTLARVQATVAELLQEDAPAAQAVAPDDLATRVTELITDTALSWDDAIWQLASEATDDA
jgi:hypothetical protein